MSNVSVMFWSCCHPLGWFTGQGSGPGVHTPGAAEQHACAQERERDQLRRDEKTPLEKSPRSSNLIVKRVEEGDQACTEKKKKHKTHAHTETT